LHTKHEQKTMHCAEGDGRWHQDKIDFQLQELRIMSWTRFDSPHQPILCLWQNDKDLIWLFLVVRSRKLAKTRAVETARSGRLRNMLRE
jgi:hypothetical protein